MKKKLISSVRLKTIILVFIIIILGSLRDIIIKGLNEVISNSIHERPDYWLIKFIKLYGSSKSLSAWISHYLIFYPIYMSMHFTLVNLLFRDYSTARKWLNWTLIIIILILVSGKVIFGIYDVPILAEYFSFAFHKLIALPFLLLVIEGGRSIYKLIEDY